MQSAFVKMICQIGTFIICTQAIIHFRPRAAYEKYLRLLVGAMILVQFLEPLGALLLGEKQISLMQRAGELEQEMRESMAEGMESAAQAQKLLEEMTLAQLQERMEERAEEGDPPEGIEEAEGGELSEAPIQVAPVEDIVIGGNAP